MTRITTARVGIAALVLTVAAIGQTSLSTQYEVDFPEALKTTLGISDAQIAELRANQALLRVELRPIARALAGAERDLRQEVRQNRPNETIVGALTMELERIRGDMAAVRERYQAQARAILTEEQMAALVPIDEAAAYVHVARQAAAFNLVAIPETDDDRRNAGDRRRGGRNEGTQARR